MFRSVRILVIALIVVVSLLGSASLASADPITVQLNAPPTRLLDITWE